MVKILDWKKVRDLEKQKLIQQFKNDFWSDKYLAIIFIWDNVASSTYVRMKQKFWKEVWLDVRVFWQNWEFEDYKDVIKFIWSLNNDSSCVWIIVQLPLPNEFNKYKIQILTSITLQKDVDWLAWCLMGQSAVWKYDIWPATVAWVFDLLDFYWFSDFVWKTCCVLWQSNLVWKPLSLYLISKWATVFAFNAHSNQELMKQISKQSDFIFSCTWKIFLVDEGFVSLNNNQVVIDIWWWKKDWKAVGDVNFNKISKYLKAYTPVPWWVWPMTILSIFKNILKLSKIYN